VRIWNSASGQTLATLTDEFLIALAVAWSPDSRFLATGENMGDVHLFDLVNNKRYAKLTGHLDRVYGVAWSPDGRFLASASEDKTVRLWDVSTLRLESTTSQPTAILSQDMPEATSVAWSPDGLHLAISGSHVVRIWDIANRKASHTLGHDNIVWFVAWSPDGRHLATASHDTTVRLWDAHKGKHLATFKGHVGAVYAVAWSPDSRLVASCGQDRIVRVWYAGKQ
jgi:WD40 repeat protein